MYETRKIRVLIADDDKIVRVALGDYVNSSPELVCVGHVANGAEAVSFARDCVVDVVLMDVHMPVVDGVAAAATLKESAPNVKVIMLSSFDDDSAFRASLRVGAVGFVLKDTSPEGLVDAVRAAHRGLRVISGEAFERVAVGGSARAPLKPVPALSEREQDVLFDLQCGLSNTQIAARRFLSTSTVKLAITGLMRKLAAKSRLEIVARARDVGLEAPRDPLELQA